MGKQEGPRSGKLRMSSSQDPEDSRALCTGTVPADRSLDTGDAGSQPDAGDRAECAGAPVDRPARGTKSATDRLDARVVEPSTGPRPPALQARGPRLDPAAVWPAERPVHLVADRGFPSRQFLWTLRQERWGWTVRLRATHRVTVVGQVQSVRTLVAAASAEGWTAQTAQYGPGPHALPGVLVIGQGLAVLPWHQHGPASVQQRLAQHGRRQAHLARKHP